jgi:hypothetical protein
MKKCMMAAVLAAPVVAPACAQSPMPFDSPALMRMTPPREAAIRECNAVAAKTYPIKDSNWPILMYRACMTEHHQPE